MSDTNWTPEERLKAAKQVDAAEGWSASERGSPISLDDAEDGFDYARQVITLQCEVNALRAALARGES